MSILDAFRLDGKKALVTGAATGLGAAMAVALAEAGADVAVHGNRRPADDIAAAISKLGRRSLALGADLSSPDGADELYASTVAQFGEIDILVNNAGVILRGNAEDFSLSDWNTVLQVNLTSVFRLSQLAGKAMLQRGKGKIINIASVAGKRGGGLLGNTAYAASKSGVIGLTKGIARELGPYGINANAVTPGLIETDMTAALTGEKRERLIDSIPLRKPGKPADVASAVVFLASSMSDFISGEIMDVDGGFMTD